MFVLLVLLECIFFFFFLRIWRPPRSTQSRSSAASDVYKRQNYSMIVIAEPLDDNVISEVIYRYQKLGSDIHSEVTQHVTESTTIQHGEGTSTGVHGGIGMGAGQGTMNVVSSLLKTAMYTALSLIHI